MQRPFIPPADNFSYTIDYKYRLTDALLLNDPGIQVAILLYLKQHPEIGITPEQHASQSVLLQTSNPNHLNQILTVTYKNVKKLKWAQIHEELRKNNDIVKTCYNLEIEYVALCDWVHKCNIGTDWVIVSQFITDVMLDQISDYSPRIIHSPDLKHYLYGEPSKIFSFREILEFNQRIFQLLSHLNNSKKQPYAFQLASEIINNVINGDVLIILGTQITFHPELHEVFLRRKNFLLESCKHILYLLPELSEIHSTEPHIDFCLDRRFFKTLFNCLLTFSMGMKVLSLNDIYAVIQIDLLSYKHFREKYFPHRVRGATEQFTQDFYKKMLAILPHPEQLVKLPLFVRKNTYAISYEDMAKVGPLLHDHHLGITNITYQINPAPHYHLELNLEEYKQEYNKLRFMAMQAVNVHTLFPPQQFQENAVTNDDIGMSISNEDFEKFVNDMK